VEGISSLVDVLLRGVEYRILFNSFSVLLSSGVGESVDLFILADLVSVVRFSFEV